MTDETMLCPRCNTFPMRRKYYRPGVLKGRWKLFACWECGACELHLEYKPFLGEVTPAIKIATLGAEMDEAAEGLLGVLEGFRTVGKEMGVWDDRTEAASRILELELKALRFGLTYKV